jgi:hypothetical protein
LLARGNRRFRARFTLPKPEPLMGCFDADARLKQTLVTEAFSASRQSLALDVLR